MSALTGDPLDVLQNSIVGVVDSGAADHITKLIEEPGVLNGTVLAGVVQIEAVSVIVVLAFDGVHVGLVVDLALDTLERLSLGNDLNEIGLLSGLVGGADDADILSIVHVDEDPVLLSVVIALDIEGSGLAVVGLVNVERKVSITGGVILAVDLLLDNLVDISQIGVDHDHAIVAVLVLVELDLLALSTELSLGLSSGQGVSALLHAVGVDFNNVSGLLDAESSADVALSSGNIEGSVGSSSDGGIDRLRIIMLEILVGILEPHSGGTAPSISIDVGVEQEILVAEGLVVLEELVVLLGVEAHSLIAESSGVGDHRSNSDRAEQELGNQLTGSGSVEVNALDVVQNTSLLRGLRNMQSPISAGELVVLVVADGAQDHRQDLIARDLTGGLEGAVGITLDERSVGAVADVALSPTGASHVAELVVGGVHGSLGILDVSGVHAIHDRGHLSAGDVALGLEGTVLITLEHTHAVQDGDGFGIIRRNLIGILESGVGADGQRQSHDQSQHHCE